MLSTLGYAVSRGFHGALVPLDLEPREFTVLRAAGFGEGQSQQAIAARLQIPPSRMVAIVDGLEARGLIERRPHPDDRRVRSLFVTGSGTELLGRAFQLALEHEQRVSGHLDDAERARLLEQLHEIARRLDLPQGAHAALRDD
jgi:DNA-binding MarR family transcriptional regulator